MPGQRRGQDLRGGGAGGDQPLGEAVQCWGRGPGDPREGRELRQVKMCCYEHPGAAPVCDLVSKRQGEWFSSYLINFLQ